MLDKSKTVHGVTCEVHDTAAKVIFEHGLLKWSQNQASSLFFFQIIQVWGIHKGRFSNPRGGWLQIAGSVSST